MLVADDAGGHITGVDEVGAIDPGTFDRRTVVERRPEPLHRFREHALALVVHSDISGTGMKGSPP